MHTQYTDCPDIRIRSGLSQQQYSVPRNTVFLNVSLGLVMLFARFLPIIGTLAIAGSLAGKKKIATTAGTLSTTNGMFVFLLIVVVLLIGALSFFPALALGPLAEFFGSIA